jgi:hypothetical protein
VDLELVNFDDPSETRPFEKGRFDLYRIGPMTLGRAIRAGLAVVGARRADRRDGLVPG